MKTRKYAQKRRARQQQRTRERIVEATVALHEALGPRGASISAIAHRAGVQRLTVYRHFPDNESLFAACTGRWLEDHPPPGGEAWASADNPNEKVRHALAALYAYYRRTARMWHVSYRDLEHVPALQGPMAEFGTYLDDLRDELLEAWRPPAAARTAMAATLRHGLEFGTWESLAASGLDDNAMAGLVGRWIDGVVYETPAHSERGRQVGSPSV